MSKRKKFPAVARARRAQYGIEHDLRRRAQKTVTQWKKLFPEASEYLVKVMRTLAN